MPTLPLRASNTPPGSESDRRGPEAAPGRSGLNPHTQLPPPRTRTPPRPLRQVSFAAARGPPCPRLATRSRVRAEAVPWREQAGEVQGPAGARHLEMGVVSRARGRALQELGTRAFYNCDGRTELTMPATFRVFGEESLMRCTALKEIHCLGGMPSFRLNCLWDTWVNIYYPVANPWPLQHIEQLEEAFQGRIEFLAEDGTDPYTPTEETTEATTEATTEPVTEATTEPTTAPTTEPTTAPTTQPPTEAATEAPTEPVTQPSTEEPEPPRKEEAPGWIGAAIVGLSISLIGLGVLLFGGRKKPRKGGKYSRKM